MPDVSSNVVKVPQNWGDGGLCNKHSSSDADTKVLIYLTRFNPRGSYSPI